MSFDLSAALIERVTALRRDLHAHPELAFAEQRTSELVARELRQLGLDPETGIARTGVVAVLKKGTSPRMIALRADMDALPLKELNTFDHRSRTEGRMHACGHDGHTAMLLGAAEALRDVEFDGTVVFVFQPAEEGEGGGRLMVEEGLFQRYPASMVFGLHNWPGLAPGRIAVAEGPVMAGTDRFEIVITGRGGHAAMPHQARDVVVAGAALVQSLQSVVARINDPLDPAVVSVTRFHAGSADNVLPERAVLGGTVRALRPEVQSLVHDNVRRIGAGIAAAHDVSVAVEFTHGYPPTINAAPATRMAEAAAVACVGAAQVDLGLRPSMGAEDFAYLAQAVPGCYVWLGNGGEAGSGCMLHSPHYDFNDEVIATGIRYWVSVVRTCLG